MMTDDASITTSATGSCDCCPPTTLHFATKHSRCNGRHGMKRDARNWGDNGSGATNSA
jgi:hypothetical protein